LARRAVQLAKRYDDDTQVDVSSDDRRLDRDQPNQRREEQSRRADGRNRVVVIDCNASEDTGRMPVEPTARVATGVRAGARCRVTFAPVKSC